MTYSYDWAVSNNPPDHTKFKDTPFTVRKLRTDIQERLNAIFYGFAAGETDVGVRTLPFVSQGTGVPATLSGQYQIHQRTVGGVQELFLMDPNGNTNQFTTLGKLLASALKFVGLVSGDILIGGATAGSIDRLAGAVSGKILIAQGTGTAPAWADNNFTPSQANALTGSAIQNACETTGAVLTGTALIPFDDSKPQQSGPEGWEVLQKAMQAADVDDIFEIEALANVAPSGSSTVGAAIYQDSNSDALASAFLTNIVAGEVGQIKIPPFRVVAGTLSPTTFKFWVGQKDAGTLTVNGIGGARRGGGTMLSSLKIRVIKAAP